MTIDPLRTQILPTVNEQGKFHLDVWPPAELDIDATDETQIRQARTHLELRSHHRTFDRESITHILEDYRVNKHRPGQTLFEFAVKTGLLYRLSSPK